MVSVQRKCLVVIIAFAFPALGEPPAGTNRVDAADSRSARYSATAAVDSNLSATRTVEIYKTINHVATNYVRSATCWASGLDLTCVAAYNSFGMSLSTNGCCSWESGTRRAGTLISPRHLIYADHYLIPHGTQLRFVTQFNTVVTRVLTNSVRITGTDLHIGVLDANVPADLIGFARVLPADFTKRFPTSLDGIASLCFNQSQQALVSDIASLSPSATNATMIRYAVPVDPMRKKFYRDKVSGDSGQPAFILLNGQLVILTVWTGGGAGTGWFIPSFTTQINSAMQALGGRHQLMPVDLRAYTQY